MDIDGQHDQDNTEMEKTHIALNSDCPQWKVAVKIVAKLRDAGHEAHIVGGAVRDALLGRKPKDVDVATSAHPDQVISVFNGGNLVGASFGVVIVEEDGEKIEIATFRKDGEYDDGRHPVSVEFCGAETDALRRDFTINALFYDPVAEEVTDYVGGMDDLRSGVIRSVGDPFKRFSEDHLRMLRAVRFSMRYGFTIDRHTVEAIRSYGPCFLKRIPAERIAMELDAIFRGNYAGTAMHLMSILGILRAILPEVEEMRGVEQPPDWHPEGDVFIHTALAMGKLVAPSSVLAWSVLLHDVGKPATFSTDADGRIRFCGHEDVGAEIAGRILARLKFPNETIQAVQEVIAMHNKLHYTGEMKKSTLRKIIGGDHFPAMIELNRVDSMSSAKITEGYVHMLDFIIGQDNVLKLPKPFITGRDLINSGYEPGPVFKRVLGKVYDKQLDGDIADAEAAMIMAVEILKGIDQAEKHE